MSKSMKIRHLRIHLLREYDEDAIDGLYYAAISAKANAKKYVEKRMKEIDQDTELSDSEKEELRMTAPDDIYEGELIVNIAEEMVILALYKTIEKNIKKMVRASNLFSEEEIKKMFNFNTLKRLLKERVTDIEGLPGFAALDELRLLNNCIKHQDKAGLELARYPSWNDGDQLSSLWGHYERLKPDVRKLLDEFSKRLVAATP